MLQIFVAEYDDRINGHSNDAMSEPGETRTLDPRIKSALLYRLSYRLVAGKSPTVNQHRDAMPSRRRAHAR